MSTLDDFNGTQEEVKQEEPDKVTETDGFIDVTDKLTISKRARRKPSPF